jgi:hypothetical protein
MTRLTMIRELGRFREVQTGKEYNLKKDRNVSRGTDHIFYIYRGKRVFISDYDFYSEKKYEKI